MHIDCGDPWFKIVDFLQQNWAFIQPQPESEQVRVYFVSDASGVFDVLDFASRPLAEGAPRRNGFERLASGGAARDFLRSPAHPFMWRDHPNGPIYSSGRYWRDGDVRRAPDPSG